jgi:hypothetical protein
LPPNGGRKSIAHRTEVAFYGNQDDKPKLVAIIQESNPSMDFDEFEETIGLMCEDIPGLESITEEEFSALVTDCWEIYQQTLLP